MAGLVAVLSTALAVEFTGAASTTSPPAADAGSTMSPPAVGDTIPALDDAPGTPSAQPAAASLPPSGVTVTLITGDRVRLDVQPDGTQSATPLGPEDGSGAQQDATLVQFTWNGDLYAFPANAVPYLSSTLDPQLFDISYLAKANLDDAHSATLPVSITHTATAAPASLPAVQVSEDSGGVATATVDKKQSSGIDDLLGSQWRARLANDTPSTNSQTNSQLDGITRISLAPAAGAPALPADLPMAPQQAEPRDDVAREHGLAYRTLTVNSVDLNGKPGTAIGFVHNVDDARLGFFVLPWVSGPASFSVPDGTYSMEVSVLTPHPSDPYVDGALVVKPQVTIDADQTITLDARTATEYRANIDKPLTGMARDDWLTFTRMADTHGGLRLQRYGLSGFLLVAMHLFSVPEFNNPKLYATPTSPVTKGSFGFMAFTQLEAKQDPSTTPRYSLVFPSAGRIPDSLTYTVPSSALTTVHDSIYGSASAPACPGYGYLGTMVYLPWSTNRMIFFRNDKTPLCDHTEYWYSSAPSITVWERDYYNGVLHRGERRTISPGQQINEVWNKSPLVPVAAATNVLNPSIVLFGPPREVTDPFLTVCAACRQDNNALLYLQFYGDSDPKHYSESYMYSSTVSFTRNGVLAFSSQPFGRIEPTALDLPLLPDPATYQLHWSAAPTSDPTAATDTKWTFNSAPTDALAKFPSSEKCAPDTTRPCSFLPLLFLTYDLALNRQSQAPANTSFPITFTVSGQQNAPAPAGLAATVSVSADDGKTWSAPTAAVQGANGAFTATVANPSVAGSTGFVSLRVQAHDAAGNSVEQTTIHAYGLTN